MGGQQPDFLVLGDTSIGHGHDTLHVDRVSVRTDGSRPLAAPSTATPLTSSRPTSPEQLVPDAFGEPSRLPVCARGNRDFGCRLIDGPAPITASRSESRPGRRTREGTLSPPCASPPISQARYSSRWIG